MGTDVARVGLTLLSNPQDAVVDVVFVHGLQGHPRETWSSDPKSAQRKSRETLSPSSEVSRRDKPRVTSPFRFFSNHKRKQSGRKVEVGRSDNVEEQKNEESEAKKIFWPEDLLKADFTKARIMTFGYDTKITQGYQAANQGNIFSHARNLLYDLEAKRRQAPNRDLIFVAHSLGGILVKEVLRRSQVDPDVKIKKIFNSTTGVFFFGTPHRGSRDWASFGEGVATVAGRLLGMDVNSQVIHALLPTGPELEICRESFTAQWVERKDNLTVRTFQESKGVMGVRLGGFNKLIVPPDSSTLDHPNQRARTIDADHIGMVKFSGRNDKGYEWVKEDIEELIAKAEDVSRDPLPKQKQDKKKVELSQEKRKCLQVLRTSNYEQFKDRNPNRLKGTCQWFLQHKHFQKWRESNSSGLLWVSADPGCGKSVLSKSLIDNDLKSTEARVTCYFFFKDDNEEQKSATSALSALLHQLFSQKQLLIHHAMLDYTAEGNRLPQSFYKLWSILTKASTDPKAGEVVCILDALDECEELGRYEIINALNAFYKKVTFSEENLSKLKFLVTSRPYLDIERRFTKLTHNFPTIRLQGEKESEAISREVNIVIKWRAANLGPELNLDNLEQSALEDGLLSMTNRTYLWSKLIFDIIQDEIELSSTKLKEIIGTLPSTVDQAYEAILSRIRDRERPRAQKLLCIIVAAKRPLTLQEMNIALAIEDHHRSYEDLDLKNEARFETTVRNLCGLFVSVIDQKVYLIHQTAKEFLIAKSEAVVGRWQHSIDLVASELLMARTCIIYLMFTVFDDGFVGEKPSHRFVIKQHTENHGYLSYAARFWATHYQQAQKRATDEILQSILKICDTHSPRFQNWFNVHWNMVQPYSPTPRFTSSIMVGSFLGHDAVVKLLLETGKAEVDSRDNKYGRTPLSWAAENGHEAVVKLLLETGKVEVDLKDNEYGRTPLSWAAENGHEAVVKLLLETGKAEVDSKGRYGRTPLSYAAGTGHEAMVKLLLKTGKVKVDLKDNWSGQTPLSWAAGNGHKAVVKLLLETGKVEVDSKSRSGRTPLSWAAENGHEAVVKLLLETGKVEVDSKSRSGRTLLSWAAGNGHDAVVKLLLDTGKVEVDSKSGSGRTPLSWAAEKGHEAVVKLLLETGKAGVNSKSWSGRTPLSWAAGNGHEAVVKLLLKTGKVEVDLKDNEYGQTPLSWAAKNGHEAVVKLLQSFCSL